MADGPTNGTEGEAGESKTAAITVKVTPTVKKRVEFVATLHDCDVGPMLYDRTLTDILAEYDAVREQVKEVGSGVAS